MDIENSLSKKYVESIIKDAIPNCSFDYYENPMERNIVFRAIVGEHTYPISFSRLAIEGFENSFDNKTSEQHIRQKNYIKYAIYCILGKEGIFRSDFRISKTILEEIEIWKSSTTTKSVSFAPSFTENILYGLNVLKDYLDKKYNKTQSDIFKKDIKEIENIINYAGEHNASLADPDATYNSLGFLKTGAFLKIIEIEKLKEKETSKRMKNQYDIKIYEIVSEMQKYFMDVKLPECASEYYADLDKSTNDIVDLSSRTQKPLIFISYATEEIELADFLKTIIQYWAKDKVNVFIAMRDIPAGADPLKTMMFDNLKLADAIIPICSETSKGSLWLWWETSSVWGRNKSVFPLFTNISAGAFGPPLNLVKQGKLYFNETEFNETLSILLNEFEIKVGSNALIGGNKTTFNKLKNKFSNVQSKIKVNLSYNKISEESNGNIHRYWLNYDITNNNTKSYNDIVAELIFPKDYLENQQLEYPHHLNNSKLDNMKDYILITFNYNGMPEDGKKVHSIGKLPGKTLRIFGERGIVPLKYKMTTPLWDKRQNYRVFWKVFIDGIISDEGNKSLDELQAF
ncbi:MAG: toll/interleukin-1 receptor domain-containing protein [Elusimicrobia bacterium]|nr:toll/interleukin-1 receptor domain-containing protein [Candidatus Liberimonas magnetica]